MTRLFNYVNFVYCLKRLSNILQLFASFSQNPNRLQWRMVLITTTDDLPCYVLDRLFDNLTDKSYWNVDDRNNVSMLRIITRETKSKFQLTIEVFSIAFVMSVIEKFAEFLNTLTIQYELLFSYNEWLFGQFWTVLCLPQLCHNGYATPCPLHAYAQCSNVTCPASCTSCESGHACRGGVRYECPKGMYSNGLQGRLLYTLDIISD